MTVFLQLNYFKRNSIYRCSYSIAIYRNISYRCPCIVIRIVSPDSCQYTPLIWSDGVNHVSMSIWSDGWIMFPSISKVIGWKTFSFIYLKWVSHVSIYLKWWGESSFHLYLKWWGESSFHLYLKWWGESSFHLYLKWWGESSFHLYLKWCGESSFHLYLK